MRWSKKTGYGTAFAVIALAAGFAAGISPYLATEHPKSRFSGPSGFVPPIVETLVSRNSSPSASYKPETRSGAYLAARYAQSRHDWAQAAKYMKEVLESDSENIALLKRHMVLAMGAGQVEDAISSARKILDIEPDHGLGLLFAALEDFKTAHYDQALMRLDSMPDGGMSAYVLPLMKIWAHAGEGVFRHDVLEDLAIHHFHAALVAMYLNENTALEKAARDLIGKIETAPNLAFRLAILLSLHGHEDQALTMMEKLQAHDPDSPEITDTLKLIQGGGQPELPAIISSDLSPQHCVSMALYDLATLMIRDFSDESARVFSQMALYLNPDMQEARLLLAQVNAINNRFDAAIAYYTALRPGDESYIAAQQQAAGLLAEMGELERAEIILRKLAKDHGTVDALVIVGDMYRQAEDYKKSLSAYDEALKQIGTPVPAEYWHVLYARGMAYERLGQWNEAETDLLAALEFQPDHPYILNYLGYAWADRGVHLDRALEMIHKAAELRPTDGYIADSLGWVYYRLGRLDDAIPALEKAAQFLPYDPEVNAHLGDAYWHSGRRLEARFQWERALNETSAETLPALRQSLRDRLGGDVPPLPSTPRQSDVSRAD